MISKAPIVHSNKNSHLTSPLNQLNKISYDAFNPESTESALARFRELLKTPFIIQIIEQIKHENESSRARQIKLERFIRYEQEGFQTLILKGAFDANLPSIEIKGLGDPKPLPEDFDPILIEIDKTTTMYAGYMQALRNYTGLCLLMVKTYKDWGFEYVTTPTLREWLREKDECRRRSEILTSIERLQDQNDPIQNANQLDVVIPCILTACNGLRNRLEITIGLATRKITKICFKYFPANTPQKARLKISINGSRSTLFTGIRAIILHNILKNPLIEHDIEGLDVENKTANIEYPLATKKTYDKFHNQFKEINSRLMTGFIEYGIHEFLEFEAYTVKINSNYNLFVQEA